MKIEEILSIESENTESVILFKEGIFLRAYERSAMRFTEYVANFKVFKKHYKIVNADVCYLGFPYSNYKILFEKHEITDYEETGKTVVINACPSKHDFVEWKAAVELPTVEDITPQILFRPDVNPKDLKNLQIYKSGYDICARGVSYLGCHIKPWGVFLSKRTRNNMERLVRELNATDFTRLHQDQIRLERSRCDSYFGQQRHYDIFRYCYDNMLRLPDVFFE